MTTRRRTTFAPPSTACRCTSVPEILARILDFISDNETTKAELGMLALVCSSWTGPATARVWRTVQLESTANAQICRVPVPIGLYLRLSKRSRSLVLPTTVELGTSTHFDVDRDVALAVGDFLKVIAPTVKVWRLGVHSESLLPLLGVASVGETVSVLDLLLNQPGDTEWADAMLAKCPHVRSLTLKGVLPTLTLKHLSGSSKLTRLWIEARPIASNGLSADLYRKIGELSSLTWLGITVDKYTDKDGKLDHLQSLTNLTRLVIRASTAPSYTKTVAPLLQKIGKNLSTLDIFGCKDGATALSTPTGILSTCPRLEELSLSSCGITNVSTVTFYILAFPTLTTLAVDGAALAHDEVSKGLLKLTLTERPGFRLAAERTLAAKLGVAREVRWVDWDLKVVP